ncbi:MAG: hypothetical protein QME76_04800 [Bacillota bacterium]|nr:hypothetical protein [Bacillota bacterium]
MAEYYSEYAVKIDFERQSEQPSRVFKAMSEVIDTLQMIDAQLVSPLASYLEHRLILDDIEIASLKARLGTVVRKVIESVDDEALANLDLRRIVGTYLVRLKYHIVKRLGITKEITDINEVIELQKKLETVAEETGMPRVPFYVPVPLTLVLKAMGRLSAAVSDLSPNEPVYFISPEGEVRIYYHPELSEERIQKILTRKTLSSEAELVMRVKKPDYLGMSMWDMQYDGRTVSLKIQDSKWLREFQSRNVDLRPGDSLRARVRIEIDLGHNDSIIDERYTAIEVLDVVRMTPRYQMGSFNYDNSSGHKGK